MKATLEQLARFVDGKVKGDGSLVIKGFCSPERAQPDSIGFIEHSGDRRLLKDSQPSAVITTSRLARYFTNAIIVDNPRLAFVMVMEHFLGRKKKPHRRGVSKRAFVHEKARLGKGVSVGTYAVVEKTARIGAGAIIGPGCFIGERVVVGEHTLLYPNVTVLEDCEIGARCIINSGTVIGSQGFGFVSTEEGHRKFPQVGRVVIEDEVEIGANCAIDRAALDETRIGRGSKLDNLVQVAHNVQIGEYTLIAAQVGISGGTKIGPRCYLGGQAGFVGGIEIGEGSKVAGQSGVFSSLPPRSSVSGYPAKPHQQAMRVLALTHKLPELTEKIKALEAEMTKLKRARKK